MAFSRQDGGEYVFESLVFVEPGREYQFKFKAGQDGPWVLDESRTAGEYSSRIPSVNSLSILPYWIVPLTRDYSSSYGRDGQPQ